jgi:hypothetical protein
MHGSCFRFYFILFIVIDILKRNAEKAEVIRSDDPVPASKNIKRCGKNNGQECGHYKLSFALEHRNICTKIMRKKRSQAQKDVRVYLLG